MSRRVIDAVLALIGGLLGGVVALGFIGWAVTRREGVKPVFEVRIDGKDVDAALRRRDRRRGEFGQINAAVVLAVSLLAGTVLGAIVGQTSEADGVVAKDRHVIVGTTDADTLTSNGVPALANHRYMQLGDDPITDARYINVEADTPGDWARIAKGQRDSTILRLADELAMTNQLRLVSFNHEPSTEVGEAGTAKEFRQAFQRFAGIMHRNAPKVRMVWAETLVSIQAGTATRFYPGAEAVDYVSSNAFNRSGCRLGAGEGWTSFGTKAQMILDYAKTLRKPVIVSEYGAGPDPRRAQWLRNATRFVENHPRIHGLFLYVSPWNDHCQWQLRTQAEYDAIADQVRSLR